MEIHGKRKTKLVDLADLIDREFVRKVKVTVNGKTKRMTVFEAIMHRLWAAEKKYPRAIRTRKKYEAFASTLIPRRKLTIIITGGLPEK